MLRMPMLFINIDYINVPSILHNVFITKPGAGTPTSQGSLVVKVIPQLLKIPCNAKAYLILQADL